MGYSSFIVLSKMHLSVSSGVEVHYYNVKSHKVIK